MNTLRVFIFKDTSSSTVMGTGQSQLSADPTWRGTWTSVMYGHAVHGTMDVVLPSNFSLKNNTSKDPLKFISEALVRYSNDSLYRPGDSILLQFDGTMSGGSANHRRDANLYEGRVMTLSVTNTWLQRIDYTSMDIDLSKGIISGTYKSTMPSDSGTFTLTRI